MGGEKASCALNREARGAAMGLLCRVPRDRETRWRGEEEVEMAGGRGWAATFRACSIIFNPYGLEGIDTD
jgi:hypothetical protein